MKHPRLTRIFLDAIWKSNDTGFYVEIGAFDGRKKNSTIILENIGWQGVCVEPTPASYAKLRENRKCRCENVALWNRKGFSEFANYEADPAWNGIVETLDDYHLTRISEAKKIFVPTVTWDELRLPKKIDYLQIDVEGAELAIMDCINWDEQKITYICIEDNASKHGDKTYYKYMESLGYQCVVQQHVDYLWFKE
jgi:FkbM family methyltransferase